MLAAQVVLIVMAVVWCGDLALSAVWCETHFALREAGIQYGQTVAAVLIVVLSVFVLVTRDRRQNEKRDRDSRQDRLQDPGRSHILDPR